MTVEEVVAYLVGQAPGIAIGGVGGALISRFTLSKAEKVQLGQQAFLNANELRKSKEVRFLAFSTELGNCIRRKNGGEQIAFDDFMRLSTTGTLYFEELKIIADAILSGKLDCTSRDSNFIPAIHEALAKVLPAYYEELEKVARRLDIPYSAKFDERNYESLLKVAEKFGAPRRVAARS